MYAAVRRWAIIALVFTFMVNIAGSVVRATGAGMGCPDWPQCFGYLIPPTDVQQLTWAPGKVFEDGQMILMNNQFYTAVGQVECGEFWEESNWEAYTEHDYAAFNPVHTWTEYINRLIGAFSGLPVLILLGVSIKNRGKGWWNAILSGAVVLMYGFEAWLGKVVVDGNLVPHHITWHLLGSVVIVLLLIALIARNTEGKYSYSKVSKGALWVLLVITVVQFILGTSLREAVDAYVATDPELARFEWLGQLDKWTVNLHRSFSWVVLVAASVLMYASRYKGDVIPGLQALLFGVVLEWLVGVALYFAGLPAAMQPVHLILSVAILASISYPIFLNLRSQPAVS